MNPLLAAIALTAVAAILLLPRRWALLAFTAGVLYTSAVPLLSLGGLTMYPVRLLMVAALARVAMRGELRAIRLNRLDHAVVALYVFTVGVFLLRSNEGQVYQIGTAVDALLSYFAARAFLRTPDDLRWWLRGIVFLLLPYVPLLWFESITFRNPFAAIGGVELARAGDLWVRGGRLRAVGTFGHPSLLGTFGGTFLALYAGMWFARRDRRLALLGMALCLGIVGAANSGGPALCVAVAAVGWMLWPMRHEMQWIRGGLLASVVVLALVMKAPIWYVLARVSAITGGDGYHRAVLLDIGFRNLDRWWLAGMPLRETAKWLPYTNTATGNVDMTNNFLQFGVTAGLGAVFLLIFLLVVAFSLLGRALSVVRTAPRKDEALEPLYWGLGVMLGVHILNWFGITYWDQTYTFWFMQLAAISGLAGVAIDSRTGAAGLVTFTPAPDRGVRARHEVGTARKAADLDAEAGGARHHASTDRTTPEARLTGTSGQRLPANFHGGKPLF